MRTLLTWTSFAVACALLATAFWSCGLTVRSVDFHDGEYHPIRRAIYAFITLASSLGGSFAMWLSARL